MTTKSKKITINIMGEKYKVDSQVNDTLKALSEALHAHEVALLTWVHRDYQANRDADKEADIKGFRETLFDYCLKIPEAGSILTRMKELDEKFDKEEKEKTQSKEKKGKGAKE